MKDPAPKKSHGWNTEEHGKEVHSVFIRARKFLSTKRGTRKHETRKKRKRTGHFFLTCSFRISCFRVSLCRLGPSCGCGYAGLSSIFSCCFSSNQSLRTPRQICNKHFCNAQQCD